MIKILLFYSLKMDINPDENISQKEEEKKEIEGINIQKEENKLEIVKENKEIIIEENKEEKKDETLNEKKEGITEEIKEEKKEKTIEEKGRK